MDDIDRYLHEDLGKEGDITSNALFTDEKAEAYIIAKEECIVAGLEEAHKVFEKTGAHATLIVNDGDHVRAKTMVLEIDGPVRSFLKGERLALNFICRMSGIATETKKLLDICRAINPRVTIAATRKTTPGFRKYEKKAVSIGGGEPHRFGLFDAVIIKDNHLRCIGSVEKALKQVKEKVHGKTIEIEVEHETDALVAARMGADVIMLDNVDPESEKRLAKKIKQVNPNVLIEVSGGITPENIGTYAPFADRISLGYVTHSVKNKDFSLEIK
jgi:nicotinate-nucleotide pyrophosphorylase (carboxylating)